MTKKDTTNARVAGRRNEIKERAAGTTVHGL